MPKKSRGETWTVYHDLALVDLYNSGASHEEISKKLNKKFGTKRTPIKCLSRMTRIRQGVEKLFPAAKKTKADPETGRKPISKKELRAFHGKKKTPVSATPEPTKTKAAPTKKKPRKKKRGKNGKKWTVEHDRFMARMYNEGKHYKEIAKALVARFGLKRTPTQCRSRIGNIRVKAVEKGNASKIRVQGGNRFRVTEAMLLTYHNLPKTSKKDAEAAPPASRKTSKKKAAKKKAAPRKAAPVAASPANGTPDPYKLRLDLGDGVVSVILEGGFAQNQDLQDKAAKFVADAAVNN